MGIDHAHRGIETRIGNTEHTDLAVVVRRMFHQPIDGVVGVGTLVEILGSLVGVVGTDMGIRALGSVPAADVLCDQDEAVPGEGIERANGVGVVIRAIRLQRVGRAGQDNRPRLGIVLGHIDPGEQMHAVPHGNAVLVLGIILGEPGRIGVGRAPAKREAGSGQDEKERKPQTEATDHIRCVRVSGCSAPSARARPDCRVTADSAAEGLPWRVWEWCGHRPNA